MQYRWNERLPKGTTAEKLSLYDPRRPRSGSEVFAGLLALLALMLIAYRFFPGLFALRDVSFWGALLNSFYFFFAITLVPLMAGAWINHRIFKMDYREDVKGKMVFSRGRVDRNALFVVVALVVICAVYARSL